MPEAQQPTLHKLVTVLCAPVVAISEPDGQIRGTGVQGLFRHDRRGMSRLEFAVEGATLQANGSHVGTEEAGFHGIVRMADDARPDPTMRYVRRRRIHRDGLSESVTVHNDSDSTVDITLTVTAAADLAGVDAVKAGRTVSNVDPNATVHSATWGRGDDSVVLIPGRPAETVSATAAGTVWRWQATVPPSGSWALTLSVQQDEPRAESAFLPSPVHEPAALIPADRSTANDDAGRVLQRCLADLRALLLDDTDCSGAPFLAAGSPWYFTLFGRDSLWAARFLLPSCTDLAGGTLRALAARQGTREDPSTEEQPGKMPHELRRAAIDTTSPDGLGRLRLPPLYYGTIDATPLWVCLLHDAWRAGLPETEVEALLPCLRAALTWITGPADPDGDGFLEYSGSASEGLANQGWKDSGDGIRWDGGGLAQRPLALCEVQGYAYAAALGGAELLDAFGDDGGPWRKWAAGLRERFRAAFWVSDRHGDYPAIALDGSKRPVTGPSSNIAHLLGTGLLDPHEAELVARQLSDPALDSGYGLRTLSTRTAGYNPLSYHCGSVWPHDTAVAVLGLAAEGHHERARSLANGLLRAAVSFDGRTPELYGGSDHRAGEPVTAYPAACSPQAWSAAGAVAAVGYLRTGSIPFGR